MTTFSVYIMILENVVGFFFKNLKFCFHRKPDGVFLVWGW